MSVSTLVEALTAAEAALHRGDAEAAQDAAQRGASACAALSARGEQLAPAQLEALRAIHARCQALATRECDRLAGAVSLVARSRRASDAYSPR